MLQNLKLSSKIKIYFLDTYEKLNSICLYSRISKGSRRFLALRLPETHALIVAEAASRALYSVGYGVVSLCG